MKHQHIPAISSKNLQTEFTQKYLFSILQNLSGWWVRIVWSAECRKLICTYKFLLVNLFTIPSPHITQPFYWSLRSIKQKKKKTSSRFREMESPTDYTCMCCEGSAFIFFIFDSFKWVMQNRAAVKLVREIPIQRKSIVPTAYSGIVTARVALQWCLNLSVPLLTFKFALNNQSNPVALPSYSYYVQIRWYMTLNINIIFIKLHLSLAVKYYWV